MIRRKIIVFDVGHPAQVHQFKHIYWALEKRGWKCLYIAKKKDFSIYLLEKYNLNYKVLSKSKKGLLNKVINLPLDATKYFFILLQFRPTILLNRFSIQSTIAAKILGIPVIGFADTEHAIKMDKISSPLMKAKLTSNSFGNDLGKNHFRFDANIELFYLHPDVFTPDKTILDDLGVRENEKYVIVRFVSWDAHHDLGQAGFSMKFKYKMVKQLTKHARVFITSEVLLPSDLIPYQIKIPPERIHDALFYASLYLGEGGTMASESACMGTPSIYVNSLDMGYVQDEEAHGLLHGYRNPVGVIEKAIEILENPDSKKTYQNCLQNFLLKKINVLKMMEWFVENYPESLVVLRNNPDYQYNFK